MHPRIPKILFPLAVVGLAACSDGSQPLPPEVDFQFTAGPACDYRAVKKDARAYFAKADDRTVQDTIRAMQRAGTPEQATDIGFDIIALIAQITKDTLQDGTFEEGSDLTNGLLACMTFDEGTEPPNTIDFTGALDLGAYDVRGGLLDPDDPVVSHLCEYVRGEDCPVGTWGVEPASGNFDWENVTDEQLYLIYGAITTSPGGGEFQLTETFDWNTVPLLPDDGFDDDVRVARCTPEDKGGRERVQRGTGVPIVLPVSAPSFCEDFESLNFGAGLLGTLRQWTHTASSLLVPQPLYASAVAPGRCCGGTAGGFTPFVVVNAGNVNLAFETQPSDGTVLVGLNNIVVLAKGDEGTPLPEVIITLTVELNQGSWVELAGKTKDTTDVGCSSTTACTPDGLATYEGLTLNKPGGYRLVATASLFGYDLAVITSDAFHISQ